MAWLNIYQTIKQIVQDAVAPEIQGLRGEIKGPSDRIDSLEKRLDNRIDGLEKRMEDKFADLGKRFDGLERQLEVAFDVRERLAAVEARLEQR